MLAAPNQRVVDVLASVRQRTQAAISARLSDVDSLTLALCASSVESEALIEYNFQSNVRREALAARRDLALSDDEFTDLFGTADPSAAAVAPMVALDKRPLASFEATAESTAMRRRLETALETTLAESAQRDAWKNGAVLRTAAQVALHRENDAAACLSSVIGGMVRTDARRVDDLKITIEDSGLDILIFSMAVAALAATVA